MKLDNLHFLMLSLLGKKLIREYCEGIKLATKLVEAEATTIKKSAIIVICILSNLPIISVGLVNILSKSSNF